MKIYIGCLDWGYEGYSEPKVAFSDEKLALAWVKSHEDGAYVELELEEGKKAKNSSASLSSTA